MAIVVASIAQVPDASGFFSVQTRDGVSWFVSPKGDPLFSLGINCIGKGGGPHDTKDKGWHYRFTDHYPSVDAWTDDTIKRMREWKFNTVGSWSDDEVSKGQFPRTPVLLLGSSLGIPWVDFFSKAIEAECGRLAKAMVELHKDDPNIVGWFTDNELGWYIETKFVFFIDSPVENETRKRLIAFLTERYRGDFGALVKDFVPIRAENFDELAAGGSLRLRPSSKGRETMHAFGKIIAERYYQIVRDVIRRYDANHLILGDRYAGYYPICVAEAAKDYVDVISTNASFADNSDGEMPPFYLDTLHRITKKPIIISEYYAAAMENQSGNKNSSTNAFAVVKTQQERAAMAERTLSYLASLPYMVGAHWFQFVDEPPKGRADGEDFNFGLVDIRNKPYELLTKTLTKTHERVPEVHRKARLEVRPVANGDIKIPKATLGASDGLVGWVKRGAYIPYTSETSFADLYACETEEGIALMLRADDYMDVSIYEDKKLPVSDFMTWTFSFGRGASPITIRFAAGSHATVNDERVRLIHNDKGLRQVVIAVVPLEAIKSDLPVAFTCSAKGYAGYMTTTWEAWLHRG